MEAAWVEAGTTAPQQGVEDGDDKAATRAASAAVLAALREGATGGEETSGKLARSEFVGFLSGLARGELELEGNTVRKGGREWG